MSELWHEHEEGGPVPAVRPRGRRRRSTPGTIQDVLGLLWGALQAARDVLGRQEEAQDDPGVLRAVHALSQCAGQYVRIIEIGDLEERLVRLEEMNGVRPVPFAGVAAPQLGLFGEN